ncbi:hypothetical protein T492DRAFT_873542 [Pavlovales sp. CCMP2436]|nr:hypothetical protein T492DRAFT_873542 [Pavlovales sp. CCMP2436]
MISVITWSKGSELEPAIALCINSAIDASGDSKSPAIALYSSSTIDTSGDSKSPAIALSSCSAIDSGVKVTPADKLILVGTSGVKVTPADKLDEATPNSKSTIAVLNLQDEWAHTIMSKDIVINL